MVCNMVRFIHRTYELLPTRAPGNDVNLGFDPGSNSIMASHGRGVNATEVVMDPDLDEEAVISLSVKESAVYRGGHLTRPEREVRYRSTRASSR